MVLSIVWLGAYVWSCSKFGNVFLLLFEFGYVMLCAMCYECLAGLTGAHPTWSDRAARRYVARGVRSLATCLFGFDLRESASHGPRDFCLVLTDLSPSDAPRQSARKAFALFRASETALFRFHRASDAIKTGKFKSIHVETAQIREKLVEVADNWVKLVFFVVLVMLSYLSHIILLFFKGICAGIEFFCR